MVSVNRKLRDAAIRHALALERFKASEVRRIVRMLERDVYPEVVAELLARTAALDAHGYAQGIETTRRLRQTEAALRKIIEHGVKAMRGEATAGLHELASVEAKTAARQMAAAVEIDWSFPVAPASVLRELVTAKPFDGLVLGEHFERLSNSTQVRIRRAMNVGLTRGETSQQIVARVVGQRPAYRGGALGITRNNLDSLVRTAINHTSSGSRMATFKENGDVVQKWQFVATLDTRTTLQCMGYDGKVYPVGEGPLPPVHIGCRSTATPVLADWRAFGIDQSKIPAGTRASMNGEVPEATSYQEWLREQPAAIQDEALGPARGAMLRAGELDLIGFDRLVDADGRPLTLAELASL